MNKYLCFLLVIFLNIQLNAVVKKPYNGKYIYTEFNNPSYYYGLLELGYGYFKKYNAGYEFSAYIKLLDNNAYQPSNTIRYGIKFNRFFRKTCGKKSSSFGYKFGFSYIKSSIYFSNTTYSKASIDYIIENTTFKSDWFASNIETFYNFRLTGRLYLELGIGITNGIEHVRYKDGEITQSHQVSAAAAIWSGAGPGNYFKSGFTGHIRLLGAFGKTKGNINNRSLRIL